MRQTNFTGILKRCQAARSSRMEVNWLAAAAVAVLGAITLIGFFWTKSKGFGRFATSTLLLIVATVLASVLFAADTLNAQVFGNPLLAVVGFAGGLFTRKSGKDSSDGQ